MYWRKTDFPPRGLPSCTKSQARNKEGQLVDVTRSMPRPICPRLLSFSGTAHAVSKTREKRQENARRGYFDRPFYIHPFSFHLVGVVHANSPRSVGGASPPHSSIARSSGSPLSCALQCALLRRAHLHDAHAGPPGRCLTDGDVTGRGRERGEESSSREGRERKGCACWEQSYYERVW